MDEQTPVATAEAQSCPRCRRPVVDRRSWNGGAWVPALYHETCGREFLADRVAAVYKRWLDEHHPLPPGMVWQRVR